MRLALLIITPAASCLAIALPSRGDWSADSPQTSSLLRQARWTHEPTALIRQAVQLLDRRLEQAPNDKGAWLQLGEALAIGHAVSGQAADASSAWQRAYELDTSDCHTGALAAGSAGQERKNMMVGELVREQPLCPEALYLGALLEREGSPPRTALLRKSRTLRSSSDALTALGQELILAGDMHSAIRSYSDALSAVPLFPEDWRPDGRTAVHARLGMAWAYHSLGKMKSARREYSKFLEWFNEPGPWHDLSDSEVRWHTILDSSFNKSSAGKKRTTRG